MDAGRRLDDRLVGWVVEGEEGVGEWSRGVYDALKMYITYYCTVRYEVLACLSTNIPFVTSESVLDSHSVEFPGVVFVKGDDLAMISHNGPMFDCSHDQSNIHTRIVMLSYQTLYIQYSQQSAIDLCVPS